MSDIVKRLRILDENRAADEIERLRDLVTEYSNHATKDLMPEIERLRQELLDTTWQDRADRLQKLALRSEAEIQRLRGLLRRWREAVEQNADIDEWSSPGKELLQQTREALGVSDSD